MNRVHVSWLVCGDGNFEEFLLPTLEAVSLSFLLLPRISRLASLQAFRQCSPLQPLLLESWGADAWAAPFPTYCETACRGGGVFILAAVNIAAALGTVDKHTVQTQLSRQ